MLRIPGRDFSKDDDVSGASLYWASPDVRRGYREPFFFPGEDGVDVAAEEEDEEVSFAGGPRCTSCKSLGSTGLGLEAVGTDFSGTIGRIALFIYSTGEIVAAGGGPREARM